jgi:hypothetical protein
MANYDAYIGFRGTTDVDTHIVTVHDGETCLVVPVTNMWFPVSFENPIHPFFRATNSSVSVHYRRLAIVAFNLSIIRQSMATADLTDSDLERERIAMHDVATSGELIVRLAHIGATSRDLPMILEILVASGY